MKQRNLPAARRGWLAGSLAAWLLLASPGFAQVPAPDREVVPGVVEAQLSPQYWIDRLDAPDALILDAEGIAAHNADMQRLEPALHDVEGLPVTLEAEQVRAWIERASPRPTRTLYDEAGKEGSARAVDRLVAALDLDAIPQTQVTRYAMVVRRADLRTFPTHLRVFSSPDDRDIDRFQESALFPGTPVAVVHRSRDRRWLFVVSQTYAAWIEADAVAFGDKAEIFAYTRRIPYLVVTGARAETVYTPERPEVSNVQLDMGVRVPLAPWPDDEPLNGQYPGYGHAVELPVRQEDGTLAFAPALIPRSADVANDYLPLTRANLIRQAFKFLGERYGWGHRYNARDCSGFVSEVYRSFGLLIPRNTSDQSRSPGLDRIAMEGIGHDRRLELLREADIGDLLYIPGHVMMVLGHANDDVYVIHDTSGMSLLGDDGQLRRYRLNGVVVTPLLPKMSDATTATVDRITSIQRVRP